MVAYPPLQNGTWPDHPPEL